VIVAGALGRKLYIWNYRSAFSGSVEIIIEVQRLTAELPTPSLVERAVTRKLGPHCGSQRGAKTV
jgi:hypothetical protein